MGMSEVVPDLILLDFVLKDRDGNFVICYSGYIPVTQLENKDKLKLDNGFDFNSDEYSVKIIRFEDKNYSFQLTIVAE